MVDTNIKGVLNGIHVVLDGMLQRQNGTIVNVSSVAGRKTFPSFAAYCSTKSAVHALSETLRQEVAGSKVRVVVVAPGFTESELLGHNEDGQVGRGNVARIFDGKSQSTRYCQCGGVCV